jgi:hypothetical protein
MSVIPRFAFPRSESCRSSGHFSKNCFRVAVTRSHSSPMMNARIRPVFCICANDLRSSKRRTPPRPDEPYPWMIFITRTRSRRAAAMSSLNQDLASCTEGISISKFTVRIGDPTKPPKPFTFVERSNRNMNSFTVEREFYAATTDQLRNHCRDRLKARLCSGLFCDLPTV